MALYEIALPASACADARMVLEAANERASGDLPTLPGAQADLATVGGESFPVR